MGRALQGLNLHLQRNTPITMANVYSHFRGVLLVAFFAGACHGFAQDASTASTSTNSSAAGPTADVVAGMLQEGYQLLDNGELDNALRQVDAALQLDAHNASAYELRGAIYIQKKLWDRAEADYTTALAISPTTTAFKYKLAEIKFLQKAYDDARPRYAAIVNDENLGDLATFKVFICDLYGGHDVLAGKELAALNKVGTNPSYYYANALWSFTHHDPEGGKKWIASANDIYGSSKEELYLSSLKETNSLHAPVVSFVAKNGDNYNQVNAIFEDDGLRISSPKQGWITIPFEQLPDDLSAFPADLRKEISIKRNQIAAEKNTEELPSFTTKQGQRYEQARVAIVDEGLQVLTPDGWVTIPFDQLPDDLSPFPDELQKKIAAIREALANRTPITQTETLSFTTKQGKQYDQVQVAIIDDGLHVLTPDGWIIVPFEQLPDDLSPFPIDVQKQIRAKRQAASESDDSTNFVTFMTKDGKQYDQVRVAIQGSDLQVLTSDGWVTIPFDELPDDISKFPASVRERIGAKRQVSRESDATTILVSFTTKNGKHYDQEQVSVEDDGVQVLTPDGWITVPFAQLPDDKSAFPADLQKKIEAERQLGQAADVDTKFFTFTTKSGKEYDNVRVLVEDSGLQVMTEDGWVTVPFEQLPDDLSPFTSDMQKQIATKQKVPPAKDSATSPTAEQNQTGAKPEEFVQP
jgi:hypothetical protein